MASVKEILMERDGMSERDAENLIAETREELLNGNTDAIMEICGLEDDYIFDFL